MSPIDAIETLTGHSFQNAALVEEAMTHASSADDRLNSNERMEFLGDAILGYVISEHLFSTFPEYEEGELTKIKSVVVSRKICARVSQEIGLDQLLALGKGMGKRSALPGSISAAAVEALIAALYLDGGIEPARKFILDHMAPIVLEIDATQHQDNFKSVLQQYAQRHLPSNPQYLLLDEKGPDHAKCFEVCVEVARQRFPSAWANSKKEAEQKAALLALRELRLATVDENEAVHMVENWETLEPRDREAGEA